jgi:hypothetical protein
MNFWANTPGHYLPGIFEMPGPPPSPQRLTIISADSATPAAHPDPNAALDLGVSTLTNPSQRPTGDDDSYRIPMKPQWPWRHVIHVADTVPLSENRLRYYDHPVIKVLAIWRELSWYEVFRQGKDTLDASKEPLSDLANAQVSAAVPTPASQTTQR